MIGGINNHKFYKKAIDKYGISARGVHWQSQFTQYLRFEILNSFIKEDIEKSTLVDAGCGFAEYLNYLKKSSLEPKLYLGIDVEEKMISLSEKRFPNNKFLVKDILKDSLPEADYFVCSGAMNILRKKQMFRFIENCLNSSKKGFVFNFLKSHTLNGVAYEKVIDFCEGLGKEIYIKDYYLDNDISIFLKH
ncbi:class I SAM-dependent methyltransferase [Halarcobacter mediterraneus]|uniref:class I SAM-dependent methyltransferase n=1 Tax=Halarcobacter mediterraneus TaxID=2023153 RepID=UPI001E65C29E|nr:class I SAM-dependent methyltransferase [Halarcobacter mediterraneus]